MKREDFNEYYELSDEIRKITPGFKERETYDFDVVQQSMWIGSRMHSSPYESTARIRTDTAFKEAGMWGPPEALIVRIEYPVDSLIPNHMVANALREFAACIDNGEDHRDLLERIKNER